MDDQINILRGGDTSFNSDISRGRVDSARQRQIEAALNEAEAARQTAIKEAQLRKAQYDAQEQVYQNKIRGMSPDQVNKIASPVNPGSAVQAHIDLANAQYYKQHAAYQAELDKVKANDLIMSELDKVGRNEQSAGQALDTVDSQTKQMLQGEIYKQYPTLQIKQADGIAKAKLSAYDQARQLEGQNSLFAAGKNFNTLIEQYVGQTQINPERADAYKQNLNGVAQALARLTGDASGTISALKSAHAKIDETSLRTQATDDPFGALERLKEQSAQFTKDYGPAYTQKLNNILANNATSFIKTLDKDLKTAEDSLYKGVQVDTPNFTKQVQGTGLEDKANRLVQLGEFNDYVNGMSASQLQNLIKGNLDDKIPFEDKLGLRNFAIQRYKAMGEDPHKVLANLGLYEQNSQVNYLNPQSIGIRAKDVRLAGNKAGIDLPLLSGDELSNFNKALASKPLTESVDIIRNATSQLDPVDKVKFISQLRSGLTGDRGELAYLGSFDRNFEAYLRVYNQASPTTLDAQKGIFDHGLYQSLFPQSDNKELTRKLKAAQIYLVGNDLRVSVSAVEEALNTIYGGVDHKVFGQVFSDIPNSSKRFEGILDQVISNPEFLKARTNGSVQHLDGHPMNFEKPTELERTKIYGKYYIKQNGLYLSNEKGNRATLDLSKDLYGLIGSN